MLLFSVVMPSLLRNALFAIALVAGSGVSLARPPRRPPIPDVATTDAEADLIQLAHAETRYGELSGVARELLTRYPPRDHVYVGLGQSPSGLLAIMSQLRGVKVYDIPLSQMHKVAEPAKMSAGELVRLHEHLAQYLPRDAVRGKSVVVIDYSFDGVRFPRSIRHLEAYLATARDARLVPVLLTGDDAKPAVRDAAREVGAHTIELPAGSALWASFLHSGFDGFSPHGSWSPSRDPVEREARPLSRRYRELVDWFRPLVAEDHALRRAAERGRARFTDRFFHRGSGDEREHEREGERGREGAGPR